MKNDMTKRLTRTAIIAAIYAVVTIAIATFSYGNIQFRNKLYLILYDKSRRIIFYYFNLRK